MRAWWVSGLAVMSMVSAAPDVMGAGGRGEVLSACKAHGYVAESACGCVADRAMKNLDEAQRAWLVASITQNETETARLQGAMTVKEIVGVGTFMTLAPHQCAQ